MVGSKDTSLDDSIKAVEFAARFDNLYATVGVHPHDAKDVTAETLTQLKQLAQVKHELRNAMQQWIAKTPAAEGH